MIANESPLFAKTHLLLLWLIPQTHKFPRAHRFGLAAHIQMTALAFQDLLIAAGKAKAGERRALLTQADVRLAQLKHWARVCVELNLWSRGQYEHAAQLLAECGRLLGAWLKR
ncbi:MAG: diversity-generating retroelement protein Avd [Anaerolineales bacterium]